MKIREIVEKMECVWPVSRAESWDNVGLLAGRQEKEVHKILVALDASDQAVDCAVKEKVDLLITHHPLIFSGLKQIQDGNFIGRRLIELIRNDISYYAMHTNFDVCQMAQLNAEDLELREPEVLWNLGEIDGESYGIGKIGDIKPCTLDSFAEFVKTKMKLSSVRVYGDGNRMIGRAAVSGGSGKGAVPYAVAKGADVLVTGDIDYHTGIDAVAMGICLIDAGHYGTEAVFLEGATEKLRELFPETEIISMKREEPFRVI